MTKRKIGIVLAATAIVIGILWGVPRIRIHPNPMTVSEMQSIISRETPVGSDVGRVMHFLDNQKIEHSEFLPETQSINAVVHRTTIGLLIEGSIYMRFLFDHEGKLKEAEVEEIFTGL